MMYLSARRIVMICVSMLLVALAATAASSDPAGPGAAATSARMAFRKPHLRPTARFETGEVLVRFAPGTSREDRVSALVGVDARSLEMSPGSSVHLVRLRPGFGVSKALRIMGRQPAIAVAEPNYILTSSDLVPNDPMFPQQWGMNNDGQVHPIADPPPDAVSGAAGADANVEPAWDLTQGSPDVVIAIIDTGVDITHPDLAPNIWVNPAEIAGNGIDDDGNGFVDDVNGWDFVDDDNLPVPGNPHGTHVAGIVAAKSNDGVGVAGVCPGCRIMPIRAGDDQGRFSEDAVIAAIQYAVDNGASIINMSFGGPAWSALQRQAIQDAGDAGVLTVVSAGNGGVNNDKLLTTRNAILSPDYPASYDLPTIVSVAASTDQDQYGFATGCALSTNGADRCFFSNFGHDSVDLAAPGVDILSTFPDGAYQTEDGTSMAAPFVTGAAGLIESLHPDYSPVDVKNALLNSAARPPDLAGGWTATSGRLDAAAALDGSTTNAAVTDGSIEGAIPISFKKRGTLTDPGDINDIYQTSLRKGHVYAASLDVPRGQDFDLFVWAPGEVDVWEVAVPGCGQRCPLVAYSAKGKSKDEALRFRAKVTGVYYFLVTDYAGKGNYLLTVGVPTRAAIALTGRPSRRG